MKRLAIAFATRDVGPGIAAGVEFLRDDLSAKLREGFQTAFAALDAVKATPDNPFGDDDEAIAGEVLRLREERIAERRK